MTARNELQELLQRFGWDPTRWTTLHHAHHPDGFSATLRVELAGRAYAGTGVGRSKSMAEEEAAAAALRDVRSDPDAPTVDWTALRQEAQAGDALIKLVVHATRRDSPAERTALLQDLENNRHLATVFDRWSEQGDPRVAAFGPGLSVVRRATVVEAEIWRRYGARLLGSVGALSEVLDALRPT